MSKSRQQQKEDTRKKILETARLVYGEQGFSTSTQIIASEAGVSHGTIFVHFPTRDELLSVILENFFSQLTGRFHQLVEAGCTMEALLEAHLQLLQENETFYATLTSQLSQLPVQVIHEVVGFQSVLSFHFTQAVDQELQRGNIKSVPLPMLFHTWLGLIQYYLQNRQLFCPEGSVLADRGSQLIETYLTLIRR